MNGIPPTLPPPPTRTSRPWQLLPHDPHEAAPFAKAIGVPSILAQLLMNRGIRDAQSARDFLSAPFSALRAPNLLPGAVAAAEHMHRAIEQDRRICIYGDYDVDGLTGTAILWQLLNLLGAKADFYVPHRLGEGYGLNREALKQLAETGTTMVVTVDCGITALAEADEAKTLGIELIITDHHEFGERLPDAAVVVHPRLPGGLGPTSELSGSAVALKVAWALCQRVSGNTKVTPKFREFLLDAVALAALGIVADVMPLRDENRILVRHGLKRLRESPTIGFRALVESTEAPDATRRRPLTATHVSFRLAPRLNAAGRLGCSRLVVELLTTDAEHRARELARFLDLQNQQRQQIERRILAEARTQLEAMDVDAMRALVLADPEWHPGVIGIVASRLVEQFGRPVILLAGTQDGGHAQGSGRSVPGFALHEALRACSDLLLSHGGHAAAAGLKLPFDDVPAFRERFCAYAGERLGNQPTHRPWVVDVEVPLSAITIGLLQALAKLEPYGAGNPHALILAGPVRVVKPTKVGAGERHLRFRVQQEGVTLPAIAFQMGDRLEELMSEDGICNIVFTPSFNEWQGRLFVQLEIRDFQAGADVRLV